jgi:hypothetical protein
METLPQSAVELEVDAGCTAVMKGDHVAGLKGDHVAGLKVECRPGGTWAERPR